MKISKTIKIDMVNSGLIETVDAVQGDSSAREISAFLFENGVSWDVPGGTTIAFAFKKQDGTSGLYDKLPDGSVAIQSSGNNVVVTLAPQVLTVAGKVNVAIVFHDENLNQLATFPFVLNVSENPAYGKSISNDYYNYTTLKEVNEAVDAALADLEAAKQDALSEVAPPIVCEASGEIIEVADASNWLLKGLTLYGRTTQNGTPSPEAPVALESAGSDGSIGVSVTGKNLFGGEALADRLVVAAKATKDTEAGTVTFNAGNIGGDIIFNAFKPNTRYTFILYGRNSRTDSRVVNMNVSYTDGSESDRLYFSTIGEDSYAVLTSDANKTVRYIFGNNYGGIVTLYYDKCGIFEGVLTEADFVPYEGQTLTVSTPNGLPGLEVKNAAAEPYANYTDAEGKKWICDEIDFVRGVYVQRIASIYVDGSQSWRKTGSGYNSLKLGAYGSIISYVGICTHLKQGSVTTDSKLIGFQVTNSTGADMAQLMVRVQEEAMSNEEIKAWAAENPFTLLYALTTPIETPLPAEELAKYAALHSNKPNTTIYNDGVAGMEVSYVADTKTYIDNKFAAISAAMLNA